MGLSVFYFVTPTATLTLCLCSTASEKRGIETEVRMGEVLALQFTEWFYVLYCSRPCCTTVS